jgi:hypothetical protein
MGATTFYKATTEKGFRNRIAKIFIELEKKFGYNTWTGERNEDWLNRISHFTLDYQRMTFYIDYTQVTTTKENLDLLKPIYLNKTEQVKELYKWAGRDRKAKIDNLLKEL